MTYAQVVGNAVQQVGTPPPCARNDAGEWLCPPGGQWTDDIAAQCGWYPVVETERPLDTDVATYDVGYVWRSGTLDVLQVWTSRSKTTEELHTQQVAVAQLEQQAAQAALTPDATNALLNLTSPPSGSPWRQPTGAHDAYPLGAVVTHADKTWESLTTANVWAPGVSGWREVVEAGYPAWVQPTGAHDAYAAGARVTHGGFDWESAIDANVWEPGVYGWVQV